MNPTYLFVHPILAGFGILLTLTAYSLKATVYKRHTLHYLVGVGAVITEGAAVIFAAQALARRTEELGDFPNLPGVFQFHAYFALGILALLLTQLTLGVTMRVYADTIPRLRRIHWWISQALLTLIVIVSIFGIPIFYNLLAGRPSAQLALLTAAALYFTALFALLWWTESNALNPRIRRWRQTKVVPENHASIHILPDGVQVNAPFNQTLLQTSLRNGVPHTHVCGGNARCSTCRVVVLDGLENCLPRNIAEERLATKLRFQEDVRLACQTRVSGDVIFRRLVLDKEDERITSQVRPGAQPFAVGRETEVAILFSDVEGFTEFAEKQLPYDVVHALNRYYHEVGRVITKNHGDINNYMGDGFLALFEHPDRLEAGHNAIAAGLEILAALDTLHAYYQDVYKTDLNIRIGVHFGRVVLGDLGSEDYKKPAAIGDAVNLTSRIESANKEANTRLLISEDLYRIVAGRVEVGIAFTFTPKGKHGKYTLYEVTSVRARNPVV